MPRHPGWWTLAILVLLSAAVPATYLLKPHVTRYRVLAALDSSDPQRYGWALRYIATRAADDDRVRRGAVAKLNTADEQAFARLVAALDTAAVWRRTLVGDGPWLRWIERLASSEDVEARIAAAQLAADAADLADEQRLACLLTRLSADAEPDVRYNALLAAGELAGAAADGERYVPVLAVLARDAEPVIARHTWIILGLLAPASGVRADWRMASPPVAEAILWAAVRTHPRAPQPALEALRDATKRTAAVYALAFSDAPEAQAALAQIAQREPQTATGRRARLVRGDPDMPPPLPADLRAALSSDDPAVRDLACVLAVQQLDAGELDDLIGELLADYDDDAKMAGAVLAGLTGRRVDLLAEREAVEDVFAVRVVQRLGLWMAGRMDMDAEAMLVRDDLPRTTILLAMLERGEYSALDHLLNPRGEVGPELADLLARRGWWWVLARALPADAPRLWPAGDAALKAFQLDVLRAWWLMNRHTRERIEDRHGKTRPD